MGMALATGVAGQKPEGKRGTLKKGMSGSVFAFCSRPVSDVKPNLLTAPHQSKGPLTILAPFAPLGTTPFSLVAFVQRT